MQNTRPIISLLVGALIVYGQAQASLAQQTNPSNGDAHGRQFVYPYSKLKGGRRGYYIFPKRTKLGPHIIPKGTKVVAEVMKDQRGRPALFAAEPLDLSGRVIPKGKRIPFK